MQGGNGVPRCGSEEWVSVLLPIHRGPHDLRTAAADVLAQTHKSLELVIVCNGAPGVVVESAHAIARQDARVRVEVLAEPHLAKALNHGIAVAKHGLIARMDADDRCPPHRLERQLECLREHPKCALVACAYDVLDESGHTLRTVGPLTEPKALAWSLLLENTIAHGSVLARKEMLLAAGGYDEACTRAQDYELWLRMAVRHGMELRAVPDVLYQHTARSAREGTDSSRQQAMHAARAMMEAWGSLRTIGTGAARDGLHDAMMLAIGGDRSPVESVADLARELDAAGPSREGLVAYLWGKARAAGASAGVPEVCRQARVREVTRSIVETIGPGATVTLFGAGRHSAWLVRNQSKLGVPIGAIMDDALDAGLIEAGSEGDVPDGFGAERGGRRLWGYPVVKREWIKPGEHVLVSSEVHEAAMVKSLRPLRERGVHVWTIYGDVMYWAPIAPPTSAVGGVAGGVAGVQATVADMAAMGWV